MLIATDLVSRGLDLTEVSHVINIDTPDLPENYIHRIGRTGRADKTGTSITFTTEEELPYLEAAEELMQYQLAQLPFPEEVYVSEELIVEEMPELRVANVQVKLDTTVPGAFHEKKKKNTKVKMTRRELTEHRNRSKVGRRKSWDPSKKKKRKR